MKARLRHVFRHYPMEDGSTLKALSGVSLDFPQGSFTVILGKSGCGKTTLLRLMIGLERSDRGEILLENPSEEIGVVFQEPRLMPWLSAAQNVALVLPRQHRQGNLPKEYLAQVGLGEFTELLPKQLSGGMAARVALARALVKEPEMLLLDEPFGALDYFTRRSLQQDLKSLVHRKGLTAVLVTHDVEEALYLASRIVIMGEGTVKALMEDVDCQSMLPRDKESFRERILHILEVQSSTN